MVPNPGHDQLVDQWLDEYAAAQHQKRAAANAIQDAIAARLDDDGLNYHAIEYRVKDHQSLEQKLRRLNSDGSPKYPAGLDAIDDVIGVRVITFLQLDVERAIRALSNSFEVIIHVDKTAEQREKGEFGYSGQHLVLRITEQAAPNGCRNHIGERFEVQFRTILQHAWAEFEHDIRYKSAGPVPPEVNRAFTLASGLIELADNQFSTISNVVAAEKANPAESKELLPIELTGEALERILEQALPNNPRSRVEQYEWLRELMAIHGITTVAQASDFIASADWDAVASKIQYKFAPGHVRAADDLLLVRFGEEHIEKTQALGHDRNRRGKLTHRLRRFRD
ncbi:GTP pyrophosphokinase [Arthrobacter sp. D2-10]